MHKAHGGELREDLANMAKQIDWHKDNHLGAFFPEHDHTKLVGKAREVMHGITNGRYVVDVLADDIRALSTQEAQSLATVLRDVNLHITNHGLSNTKAAEMAREASALLETHHPTVSFEFTPAAAAPATPPVTEAPASHSTSAAARAEGNAASTAEKLEEAAAKGGKKGLLIAGGVVALGAVAYGAAKMFGGKKPEKSDNWVDSLQQQQGAQSYIG